MQSRWKKNSASSDILTKTARKRSDGDSEFLSADPLPNQSVWHGQTLANFSMASTRLRVSAFLKLELVVFLRFGELTEPASLDSSSARNASEVPRAKGAAIL